MADTFTKEERSEIMRRVKGRDTSPEIALRKRLWALGLRGYRLHNRNLPGSPDLVFSKKKVAIFIDGCFWHGCPKCYRRPSSRRNYWDNKVKRNVERDKKRRRELRKMGWKVIRVWEHEVTKNLDGCVRRISKTFDA